MSRRLSLFFLQFFFISDVCLAEVYTQKQSSVTQRSSVRSVKLQPKEKKIPPYRGWSYIVGKLKADGVPENTLQSIYNNRSMPIFSTVYFSLSPKESHAMYSQFRKDSFVKIGMRFLERHKKTFDEVERTLHVNRYVIASILLVETRYGENTGKDLIINRLSRVASVGEPQNLQENYAKLKKEDPTVSLDQVKARAEYLEKRFYPEVLAIFELGKKHKVNVLQIRGSSAGAFGIPQFLPSTFMNYAMDGNKDGKTSLYNTSDAIFTTANYLSKIGWKNDGSDESKRKVIWEYNHSEPYIDTVLDIAERLRVEVR